MIALRHVKINILWLKNTRSVYLACLHSARMHEIKILSARKITWNFKIWLTSESIK